MDETTQTIAAAQKLEDATAAAAGLEPRPLTTTWWRWSRMLRAELPGDGDLAQADEMFWGVAWRWRFLAMKGGARDEMLTLGLLGLFRAAVNFDPRCSSPPTRPGGSASSSSAPPSVGRSSRCPTTWCTPCPG